MLERFPFWDRAAFLAALMVMGALIDLWRYGKRATRYQEYAFIWFTGLLGCLIGGITDRITSSISSEYFTLGKGLMDGNGFTARAIIFGIKEGISAGVIAGAICVFVSRRKSKFPPLALGRLTALLWIPITCAIALSILLPLIASHSDPAHLATNLGDALPAAQFPSFLRVWWIHTGLYTGLLIGLILLLIVAEKLRRSVPRQPNSA